MKDFDNSIPQFENIEIISQNQHEKQPVISNIVMHKGHTMFEINCQTGEIIPAKFQEVNATLDGGVKKKLLCNKDCLYVPCLNIKNARKKFAKYIFENIKPD
jgi:hypothetical protein